MPMTIRDVIDQFMEYPIETHERVRVKIQIFNRDTGEVWTQEQHDALNAEFELLLTDPEEE